jgi:hypothetical protein
VQAGIAAGDTVEVTTNDGRKRTLEVVKVSALAIESADEVIPLGDISKLVKRSWEEPTHPCGDGLPVGCSIPELVLVLSEDYENQAGKFHPACVTHDYCYRHGSVTYGATREECDDIFLADMKQACKGTAGLDMLDRKEYSICQLAASQSYEAVRKYGEKHFRTTTGTYCDYRW